MQKLKTSQVDKWGIGVSLLCAVHCALMPVVVSLLPLWGLGVLQNPYLELAIIGCSLVLATTSLIRSYSKHREWQPFALMLCGLTLITTGHFWAKEPWEWVFLTAGGITMATAHLRNWHLDRSCKAPKPVYQYTR